MKKSKLFVFLIIIILSLTLFSCTNEAPVDEGINSFVYQKIEDKDTLNNYNIKVDLDTSDMIYSGEQYTIYLNRSEDDLDYLYFHLYPNAFKTLEDAPILFDEYNKVQPSEYKAGYIDIYKTKVDGELSDHMVERNSEILKIKLPKPLKNGEKTEIYIKYRVKIPSSEDRFGFHENGINLGNWYPIASVYDKDGWHLDPYYKVGDPFFSEVSDYNVEIRVPKELEIASSGKIISEELEGKSKVYTIKGDKIRDFAFVASENFVSGSREVNNTLIKLYSIVDNQEVMEMALDYAEDAIKIFNEKFGVYPYDEYRVVVTEFPSGMEYPGIVFVSSDYYNESLVDILETVIAHETAHQWWYGIVGTDQINNPWIDEGLASYSEVIYLNEVYGGEAADMHYNLNIKSIYEDHLGFLGKDRQVNKHLSEFKTWNDYSMLIYSRGVGFFKGMETEYGKDVLEKILQETYNRYKFKNISHDEFLSLCEEITGDSMQGLVEKHLN